MDCNGFIGYKLKFKLVDVANNFRMFEIYLFLSKYV